MPTWQYARAISLNRALGTGEYEEARRTSPDGNLILRQVGLKFERILESLHQLVETTCRSPVLTSQSYSTVAAHKRTGQDMDLV